MTSISRQQLTLSLEPSVVERWPTLRRFLAHRVEVQPKPAKTIAAEMDMSPSALSRKLNPGDADTARFNIDDLELYLERTGDVAAVIEYLATKFMGGGDDARVARLMAQAEAAAALLSRTVAELKDARA
jgi:hypothetical protein